MLGRHSVAHVITSKMYSEYVRNTAGACRSLYKGLGEEAMQKLTICQDPSNPTSFSQNY